MIDTQVLLGRAAEVEAIRSAVANLADGKGGGVMLIEGEAGIGKTTLLQVFIHNMYIYVYIYIYIYIYIHKYIYEYYIYMYVCICIGGVMLIEGEAGIEKTTLLQVYMRCTSLSLSLYIYIY